MRTRLLLATGLGIALFASTAPAATDFVDTTLRPPASGGLATNNGNAGNWVIEGTGVGDGNSNRIGGAANPQIGNDDAAHGSVPIISVGNGTNGKWTAYNYLAAPGSGLTGSNSASLDATFRVRNMNNGGGQNNANAVDSGEALLQLALGATNGQGANGVGVMLTATQQQTTDLSYYYKLVLFESGSTFRKTLWTSPLFNTDASSFGVDHQDPNYEHAIMSLDRDGNVKLNWNGTDVYTSASPETALGTVESRAWVGSGTAINPWPGNARSVVWYQGVTLTASSALPEPASIMLLGVGFGLVGLRRRRTA
jgi:hypothetical protein